MTIDGGSCEPQAIRLDGIVPSRVPFAFVPSDEPGCGSAPAGTGTPQAMRPVVFGNLFGWFAPGTARRGVILCGTPGFEQLSAYQGWRDLGDRVAATGCATLRFDYPGEGDSGDDDAGCAAAWIASIRTAIAYLREVAEVEEVVLVGLRFGGTLAALAAQGGGVDRLVLLAPFASGRAYLREMTLRASTIDTLPDGTPFPKAPGLLTVGGFHLGTDLVADVSGITLDPKAPASVPVPRVLVLGDASSLAARYAAAGSAVSQAPFPGLAQLISKPLFAEIPDAAFRAVVDFVADGALPRATPPRPIALGTHVRGEAWTEEAERFGPGLFGILCRPRETTADAPVVLFVNSGTNVRWGYGRQTTAFARRLAATGVPSLRLDLRGVGDSPARPDGALPLYDLEALDDLDAAVGHLAGLHAGPVVVVGCCSGAHLSFHATCCDPRIAGSVLVNLYCFDWNPKDDVETTLRKPFRSAATYATLIRSGSAWRRVLRNEVRVGAILKVLARTALTRLGARVAALVRPGHPGGTVAVRLRALRHRGTRLRLVYGVGEPGLAEVRTHLGRSPARVAAVLGSPVVVLPEADHNLSLPGPSDALFGIVEDLIGEVRNAGRRATSAANPTT